MQCNCHAQLGRRLLLAALLVAALPQTARAAASPQELLAAGRADEAIQTLELQISHSSTDAESFNLLCRAYFMIDEWDRGIPSCERATPRRIVREDAPDSTTYGLSLHRRCLVLQAAEGAASVGAPGRTSP